MASPIPSTSLHTETTNPDPILFYEVISTKTIKSHCLAAASTPQTPLYTIENHEPLSSKKPSILLHSGSTKSSPVCGVVKLHSQRSKSHTIGIGNPDALLEEGGDRAERIVWERLQRIEKSKYRRYEFEYGGFGGKVFTWRRTRDTWGRFLRNVELRAGREEDGEVVAEWRGCSRMNVKRGSFFIKRRGEELEEEEWKRWETAVLLTGLAIIEAYRRRSR